MSVVSLSLRAPLDQSLDLDGVHPARLSDLSQAAIASLTVSRGGRDVELGALFDVRGERSDHVRIEGDLSRAVRIGAGMTAGRIEVIGSVGDDAGLAMSGGVLTVTGDAGDRFCAAAPGASKGMSGGEAVVGGSVGAEAGARARRGLIVVGGNTGPQAARDIIAGTLVVFGRTGAEPGRRSKRGSIVALGGIDVPSTYRFACTYEPPWVRMLMTYLSRTYGIRIHDDVSAGRFDRYCGDAGEPGKGEILEPAEST